MKTRRDALLSEMWLSTCRVLRGLWFGPDLGRDPLEIWLAQRDSSKEPVESHRVIVLLRKEPIIPQELLPQEGSNIRIITISPSDFEEYRCFEAIPVTSNRHCSTLPSEPANPTMPGVSDCWPHQKPP